MIHTIDTSEAHQANPLGVYSMSTWVRFVLTLAILLAMCLLQSSRLAYANSADTPSNVTGTSVTVTGTCTDAVATPTVVAISESQGINEDTRIRLVSM